MIKLYNTLTRQKEILETVEPNKVKIYVCGPTTYNFIHLGNARPIVVFDTIRRYLQYKGYEVTYVQNFTDIDDKIINKAKEEEVEPLSLSQKYIEEYFKDADALNVKRADVHPKVSDHIDEIIKMVADIAEKGYAYEIDGDVYFDVRSFPDYGKLSGRSIDELKSGARIEVDERKKDPLDFAVWKKAKPEEMSWESPWGKGRPGWHIECSAMSLKYLGGDFDIHGGGHDLIFPHHENEIAQSQACGECGFAKYWLHNGFITINQEKMSKSLGNFFLVREILDKYTPDIVRFYLLATHYRSPLDFDDQKLDTAAKGLNRIRNVKKSIVELINTKEISKPEGGTTDNTGINEVIDNLQRKFTEAMDDDFNTALAIAALFDFTRDLNSIINSPAFVVTSKIKEELKKADKVLEQLGGDVLGIFIETQENDNASDQLVNDLMEILIMLRAEAREQKQWALADRIRDSLSEKGIVIEDSPQGTKWKLN